MANRELNVDIKIGNLTSLQEDLRNLTANVKVASPDLTFLQNAARDGLNINVRLNFISEEFKQLLDLSKNGIRVNVSSLGGSSGGSSSGLASQLPSPSLITDAYVETVKAQVNAIIKSQEQRASTFSGTPIEQSLNKIRETIYKGITKDIDNLEKQAAQAASGRRGITDRELKARFEQAAQATAEDARQRNRPAFGPSSQSFYKYQDKIRGANEDLSGTSFLTFGDKRRSYINKGLDAGSLQKDATFFNPDFLLKDKSALQAFFFSGLLGGPLNAIGGALGGSTIGGSTGVLAGTAVISSTVAAFEKLSTTLKEASEASVEFQRSVAGITGVIGSTQTISRDGVELTGADAYLSAKGKATSLLTSARQALIPLGFGGAEENSLARAFIQTRAGQGFLPSEATTKTVLERLGAFIQTSGGDISSTRIFKDVTDILSGSPVAKNTALGARLKGITPELFSGKTLNDAELVKATNTLQEYVTAVKNGNDFLQQRIKVEGELSNLQLSLGEGFNKGLTPGMKALAEVLGSTQFLENIKKTGEALGELTARIIKLGIEASRGAAPSVKEGIQASEAGVNKVLAAKGIQGQISIPNTEPDFFGEAAKELGSGIGDYGRYFSSLFDTGLDVPNINIKGANKQSQIAPNAESKFTQLLNNFGFEGKYNDYFRQSETTNKNNPFQLLSQSDAVLNNKIKLDAGDLASANASASLDKIEALKKIQSAVAQTFESGSAAANQSEAGFIQQRVEASKQLVNARNFQLSDAKIAAGEDESNKNVIVATNAAKLAQVEYAQSLQDVTKNAKEALEIQIKRNNLPTQGIDTFGFGGKLASAQANFTAAGQNISSLQGRFGNASDEEKEQIQAKIREEQTRKATSARAISNLPVDIYKSELDLAVGFKNMSDTLADLKDREKDIGDAFSDLADKAADIGDAFAELGDRSKELHISLAKTIREREDFNKETTLRKLNRGENILQAADQLAALGGNISGLPAGLLGLVNAVDKTKTSFEDISAAIDENSRKQKEVREATKEYNSAFGYDIDAGLQKGESTADQQDKADRMAAARSRLLNATLLTENLTKPDEGNPDRKRFNLQLAQKRYESIRDRNSDERGNVEDEEAGEGFNIIENRTRRGIGKLPREGDKLFRESDKLERERAKLGRELEGIPLKRLQTQFSFFQQARSFAQEIGDLSPGTAASVNKLIDPAFTNIQNVLKEQGIEINLPTQEDLQAVQRPKVQDILHRFDVGDRENGENISEAANRQKDEQAKNIEKLGESLTKDTRTLSQLSRADLVDSINSGATLALGSHFN